MGRIENPPDFRLRTAFDKIKTQKRHGGSFVFEEDRSWYAAPAEPSARRGEDVQ